MQVKSEKKGIPGWLMSAVCLLVLMLVVAAASTVTVFADTNSVTFTNETVDQPDLYITKTVTTTVEGYTIPDAEFTFVLKWDLDGDGTLSYAKNEVYTVYTADGTQVKNYDAYGNEIQFRTDSAGRFTLKAGQTARFEYVGTDVEYEITEINLEENWVQTTPANGSSAAGTVDEKGTIVYFENTYIPTFESGDDTSLYVTKSTVDVFGNSMDTSEEFTFTLLIADEAWAGKTYTIYDLSGNKIGTGTTKDDGTFTISGNQMAVFDEIPLDEDYSVTETVPDGWTCLTDTEAAGGTGSPGVYAYFTNKINGGYITLNKVNTNGAALTGAVFGIYSDEYCTDLVAVMTSGKDGAATSRELNPGTYYVKENKAPDNYALSADVYSVVVSADKTSAVGADGKVSNSYIGGVITLTKTDEDDGTVLPGAVFGVYSDEECKILIDSFETGADGTGVSSKLDLGTYYVKEIEAPDGYIRSGKVYTVVIDGTLTTIPLTEDGIVENTKEFGSIKIIKKDGNGGLLSDVKFQLKSSDGKTILVKTTDANGEVLFEDLVPDTYTITEIETVSGMSLLADSIEVTIPYEISADDVAASMAAGYSLDVTDAYLIDGIYYFYNLTYTVTNAAVLDLPYVGSSDNREISRFTFLAGMALLVIAMIIIFLVPEEKKRVPASAKKNRIREADRKKKEVRILTMRNLKRITALVLVITSVLMSVLSPTQVWAASAGTDTGETTEAEEATEELTEEPETTESTEIESTEIESTEEEENAQAANTTAYGWVEFATTEGGSLSASFAYEGETEEIGTYTYDMMEYGPWEAQFETTGELTVTATPDEGYALEYITVMNENGDTVYEALTDEFVFVSDASQKLIVTASFAESETESEEIQETAVSTYSEGGLLLAAAANESLWWFSNYYVNESNLYYVEETDDFTLKYQIEFHTSEELETGAVEICVPAALLVDRDGNLILPTDIGVPYGEPSSGGTTSKNSPFNYYYADADGNVVDVDNYTGSADDLYLVFWNYRTVISGTNASFQVLYKNIDIMDVVDGTDWSLTPVATVTTNNGEETSTGSEMTGLVDTGVVLTSVTKTAYNASGKSYTPELYTENQVSSYITGSLPSEYSGANFDNYKYVVWKITVKGDATQPWSLTTEDITSLSGNAIDTYIVGYKWCNTATSASTYGWSNGTVVESDERTINLSFYVVTAYPADEIQEGDVLENTITQTITPVDGLDDKQSLSASAELTYMDYDWDYSGNVIGIDKYPDSSKYSGWLDIYKNNKELSTDTGSFYYYTISKCFGYGFTHNTLGENQAGVGSATGLGEYIDGTYYEVTTTDDVIYAYPNSDKSSGIMLDGDDYYFSGVSIYINDSGYDVYEDATASVETVDDVDQNMYIYAMFADDDSGTADPDGWTYIGMKKWTGSGTLTYTFSDEDIAKKPYRVKVVHGTVNYSTICTINVYVTLRYDSPKIASMIDSYGDDLTNLTIENISGVSGWYQSSCSWVTGHQTEDAATAAANGYNGYMGYIQETETDSNYNGYDSGVDVPLRDFTKTLYGVLVMRDNAYATLTELEKSADSTKYATVENDAANARVLVDYYLTAYEGYIVSDSSTKSLLESQGVSLAGRTEAVFYDLLPYGMKFNASAGVTAGRLTTISGSAWKSNDRAWAKADVTVTVGDEDVIENWNGTGRTMVIFHVSYSGDDPSVYSNGHWLEGYGVHFQTYYDWTDMGNVSSEYNIAAYMPESGDETPLYGSSSEVYCDDGTVPTTVNDDYYPFTCGDINGDGVTDIANVLYARALTNEEIATAAENSIIKLVKADDDTFASFDTTTAVGLSKGYTYEITITNTESSTLSGLVIYDKLENALYRLGVSGETVFENDTDGSWVGTFVSVVTDSLTSQGIAPVVYYNANRDAVISDDSDPDLDTPQEALTENNGWYTAEEWEKNGWELSEVRAIAVDISKTNTGADFKLNPGESVSFQIKMQAPDTTQAHLYAYNNPVYYSIATMNDGSSTTATVTGTSVRVELADIGTLEVEKEFDGDVPDAWEDWEFTFTLADGDGDPMANQKYVLYTYENGKWVADSVIQSTDVYGQFKLTAGQKAVFLNVANYTNATVTETQEIFFDSASSTIAGDQIVSWLFTNTYKPVVYATKSVNLLNQDVDTDNYEFTYQILVFDDASGEYVPLADSVFYYVSEASSDGVGASVLGSGITDSDGKFTIKAGEIIALFPGSVDTKYCIQETDTTDDFFTLKDMTEGTVTELGQTATITNIYRWRYLTVVKSIEDSDTYDTSNDEFTFTLTDDAGNPVSGKTIVITNEDGTETTTTTDRKGQFTIKGAGSATIYGLEHGVTYTVTETDYDTTLYQAVNGGEEDASIGTYVAGKTVTITNQYLMRDLSVTKLVVSEDLDDDDAAELKTHEFTFYLEKLVNGAYEAVSGAVYTVNGIEYTTGTDGSFTLKNGETAEFEDIGYEQDVFRVTEKEDLDYPQVYPTDGAAYLTLAKEEVNTRIINGQAGLVSIRKELYGIDDVGETFAGTIKDDNTTETLADGAYTVTISVNIYDTSDTLVQDEEYTAILLTQSGEISSTTFMGTYTTELAPYDQLFIAGVPDGYTVKVTESSEDTLVILELSTDMRIQTGADHVIIEAETSEGEALAGGNETEITLVNNAGSADESSAIYKVMTASSTEVPTGARLIIQIQEYNGSAWVAASGIRYILMDDDGPISGIQETGSDGKITLTKTGNGYPYVQFIEDKVYANVYTDMETGDLRAIELLDESSEEWGSLVGYKIISNLNTSLTTDKASTFVNGNDSDSELIVKKVMETEDDEYFTFKITQIISASELPVTSESQVLATEPGAGLYYVVYDSETDTYVTEGYTDENGCLSIQAGQYAVVSIPDGTSWLVYEQQTAGYQLVDITGSGTGVEIEDNTAYISEKRTVFAVYSADDNSLTFYNRDIDEVTVGSEYNGKTVTALYTGFDTAAAYSIYSSVPWKDYNSVIKSVTVADVFSPLSTTYWFYNFSNCKSMDLTKLDTSNVTNMKYMFYNCATLTELDVNGFDTANVTSMRNMFFNCAKLTELDVSGFDTANVTDMQYMFYFCSSLTKLDVSKFDTANVTNMGYMFYWCLKLKTVDVGGFDTANVTNMSNMFGGCSALTTLDVSKFDTAKVTNMSGMFRGCGVLTTLDVSKFDTAKVTTMSNMFYNCGLLRKLELNNWNTEKVTDMSGMFHGCYNLTELNLSSFNTNSVTNMGEMFQGCWSLTELDLRNFNTGNVTNMGSMFYNCFALKRIYAGGGWNTNYVSEGRGMFSNCSVLVGGAGTACDGSNNVDVAYAHFDGGTSNPGYLTGTGKVTFAIYSSDNSLMFYNRSIEEYLGLSVGDTYNGRTIVAIYTGFDLVKYNNASSLPWYSYRTSIKTVSVVDQITPLSTAFWFYGFTKCTSMALTLLDTSNVTDMQYMFYDCRQITSLVLNNFDTSMVTSMSYMFYNNYMLGTLVIGNWNTGNVTDMSYMFYECERLDTVYIGNCWDTGSVTNMRNMFYNCLKLSGFNTSGWDTSKVTDMRYMFYFCKSLTSLDVSGWDTSRVTNMSYMFYNCYDSNLNTSLDVSSWDTSKVTNMSYMFYNCTTLSVDVSGWDTSNVTNMSYMFACCFGMTEIDVSGFNTSKVTNMSGMFNNCWNIKIIDAGNWNTSNVTNTEYMFAACYSLETIYAGAGWNTEKVTKSTWMFNSNNLKGGDGTTIKDIKVYDVTYARIDNLPDTPGYLTAKGDDAVFAVYSSSDNSLTFYVDTLENYLDIDGTYNGKAASAIFTGFDTAYYTSASQQPWYSYCSKIEKVVVADELSPVNTAYWFYGLSKCTSMDLSKLNMENVTTINYMFYDCSSLTDLDISGWDTGNVTNMRYVFYNCTSLTNPDVSGWNTEKVTWMDGIFQQCSSLDVIDISGWDTGNVIVMNYMFKECTNLVTIYVGFGWSTESLTSYTDMFYDCTSLIGGEGTVYNSLYSYKTYARIDNRTYHPGYFTYKAA